MAHDINKIPKLPYGEGTISIFNDDLLIYKKTIKLKDGSKVRKSVYGKTSKECMNNMRTLENELNKSIVLKENEVLCDEMYKWLANIKRQRLKDQSYKRLYSTIKNSEISLSRQT